LRERGAAAESAAAGDERQDGDERERCAWGAARHAARVTETAERIEDTTETVIDGADPAA